MSKITMIYSLFGENDFILNLELQKLVKDFQINKFEIYRYAFENNDISIDDIIKIKENAIMSLVLLEGDVRDLYLWKFPFGCWGNCIICRHEGL